MAENTVIDLVSSDYDELEVFFNPTANSSYRQCAKTLKGSNIALAWINTSVGASPAVRYRPLQYNSDTKYIATAGRSQFANSNEQNTDNGSCVPIAIYGIKY